MSIEIELRKEIIMYNPKTHKEDSREYTILKYVEFMLNETAKANNDSRRYSVETIYFDYGLDWLWTTIVSKDTNNPNSILGSYQFLAPNEQEKIFETSPFEDEFEEYVEMLYTRKDNPNPNKRYSDITKGIVNEITKLNIGDSVIDPKEVEEIEKILGIRNRTNEELRTVRNAMAIAFKREMETKYVSATVTVIDSEMFNRGMEI